MNRRLSILIGLLSTTLLIILVSACQPESISRPAQQATTVTTQPTATATAASAAPTLAVTSTLNKPPACQFKSAAPVAASSTTESYTFSEPRVVYTRTGSGILSIYGWLPDNNQLIINDYDKNVHLHTIELLNVQTGELHRYAERQSPGGWVAWLPQQQALAYSDFEYLNQQSQSKYREDLWISWGSPQQAQRVATGVDSDSLAIEPTGHVTYFPREGGGQPLGLQLQRVDVTTLAKQVPSLDLAQWDFSGNSRTPSDFKPGDRRLRSTWRPGQASQVIVNMTDSGMLLADAQTGQICEIEIRQQDKLLSGSLATWSLDGRYLAMSVRPAMSEGDPQRHLAVLDMDTGQPFFPDSGPGDLLDIEWGADNQHLVALMQVVLSNAAGDTKYELYMIDILTQTSHQILPEAALGGGTGGRGEMGWSPDGRYLAINCPIRSPGHSIIEQRICLITISEVP